MIKKLFFIGIVLSAFLCACTTEDSASEEKYENTDPLEIGFGSYLGRSANSTSTRAGIYTKDVLGKDGIGIYAMYTKDQMFSLTGTTVTRKASSPYYDGKDKEFPAVNKFDPNFMSNIKLWDKNEDGAWTYTPVHYWPMHEYEFITFLSYGPYTDSQKLYTKTETTEGATTTTSFAEGGDNPIYLKYELGSDTKDVLWNYNPTWNMQLLYQIFNGEGQYRGYAFPNYSFTGNNGSLFDDQWQPSDTETYPYSTTKYGKKYYYYHVKLKMAHACSRIAFKITCPSLLTPDNYGDIPDGQTSTESGTQITVDKVVLLGDAKSGDSDNPKGVFYKSGYLNLLNTDKENAQWEGLSDDKVAYSFNKFNDGSIDETLNATNIWNPTNTENAVIKGTKDKNGNITVNNIGSGPNDYLFVIPQDFRLYIAGDSYYNADRYYQFLGRTSGGNPYPDRPLYVYIEYTVKYKDGTTGTVKDDGIKYSGYGWVSQNFLPGHSYVLNIQIGRSDGGSTNETKTDFNAIHFGVDVDPWANESSVDVNGGFGKNSRQPEPNL